MGFYVCSKCGHQFVRDIKPCPDCNSDKGFELFEKKIKSETKTSAPMETVKISKVEVKKDKPKKKKGKK